MRNLNNILSGTALVLLVSASLSAQSYKESMYDPSVNFYDVVQQAEQHFEREGTGEGSGFKGFQRWKYWVEPNYAPSGDRSESDFYFPQRQFQQFLQSNSSGSTGPSWRDLGPYRIDDIAGGYNPGLGRVESFYVDPNDTNRIYLGSRSGGFWRTLDGGATWTSSTTDFLSVSGVNAMTVSPTNYDSVLINLRSARNGTSHGIYRSIDGGLTWDTTAFNPANLGWGGLGSNVQVYEVEYHPQIPGRVYVGTSQGLYISDDDLQTWVRKLNSSVITQIHFHPSDTGIIYFYDNQFSGPDEDKVIYTEDGGQTFASTSVMSGNSGSEIHLSVSPVCPDCIYAASNNGVWKTLHRDSSFTYLATPPKSCDGFAVSDVDTSIMIYGMLEIYASYDGGRNWFLEVDWTVGRNPFNSGKYIHADLRRARCINGTFYAATDGYLGKTWNPAQNWPRLSSGTGIRENYAVGVSQGDYYYSLCGSQDNGTSLLRRQGWLEVYGADGMEGLIHPLNRDYMVFSFQYGGRRRSDDAGWTSRSSLTHNDAYWEAPLLMDPLNQMRLYSFGTNIYRSDDFGLNWNQVSQQGNSYWTEAAIAENTPDLVAFSRARFLNLSRDGGQTFNAIWAGLPSSTITDICFAPHNDSIILVTYASHTNDGKKIYMTTDQGASWQNITYNLGDMPLRSVVVDHLPNPNIYVGAEIGVFTMPLNGSAWQLYNKDLPNCAVNDLKIIRGTNTLRGATWGRGLWETDLVGRESHPRVLTTSIDIGPFVDGFGGGLPSGGDDQDVRCKIEYNGTLSSVYLQWSANDLDLDSTVSMYLADSLWQTVRPIKAPGNSDIYFKVFAVGSNGDTSETYRFMYRTFGSGVGVEELSDAGIKVYPNPTTGITRVELPDNWSDTRMSLVDIQGNQLENFVFGGGEVNEIDISQLPPGIYVLRWDNNRGRGHIKLCRQ